MSTKLFTTQQAAQMIGYTDSRLRQLIASGKAKPSRSMGGTWLFSAKEIERLRWVRSPRK